MGTGFIKKTSEYGLYSGSIKNVTGKDGKGAKMFLLGIVVGVLLTIGAVGFILVVGGMNNPTVQLYKSTK